MPRVPSSPSDRLRALACQVEQIGRGRADPEAILLSKFMIAGEMRRLAQELGT